MKSNKANKVWVFGKHAVAAALESDKRVVFSVMATKNAYEDLKQLNIIPSNIQVEIVDANRISIIVGKDVVHQGCAALVSSIERKSLKELLKNLNAPKHSMIIALDQLTDPHNVGAIIRSAAALGADAMIVTQDNSAIDSPILAKASSGGIERLDMVCVPNLVQSLKELSEAGYWVVGLDTSAHEEINKINSFDKVVIVMGSEGTGLRRLTQATCDVMLKIPMSGAMESLNVSNAAAIAMFCHTQRK